MSSNALVGGKKTFKMSPNWRYAVPNFQLEMNDQTWPELPSVGTKMLNKDTCVPKTHVSKFCGVGNRDKLSENHKSFPISPAEQSNRSGTTTCFCECEVTLKQINHMETVINRTSEHASSKGRITLAVECVKSNFSATKEKNDPIVPERRFCKIGQKIEDSDLMENCRQGVHKKTDTKLAALYERNFQNDFLLEFPTLDVNKKEVSSKSGQLHKHYNDNKHSLGGNTKKPKAKDPIFINIRDIISTIPIKPKLVRRKFKTRLLSTSLVNIVKPVPKRVYASAHTCGNALDSDKPFRRRGKVRANKKFKPSQLKAIILKTREETLKTRQAAKMRLINSKTLLLNDFAPSLYTNIMDLNGKSLKEVCTNGNEKDSGQYTVIHNNGKIATSPLLHTRKFREYCNNCLTTALVRSVSLLVETLVHYQDRQYARDPIKAHAKRRYVVGLREARKYIKMKRIRMLIIAPDLEHIPGEGGLDYTIQQLKSDAEVQHIPYLFGPSRKQLGKSSRKNVLVSCIAILNYEGAETKEKEESVDTEAIVPLLQKLTCSGSNTRTSQKETADLGKHRVSSPFLATLENIL